MSDDIDFAHISTRSDFARELTAARERAGLTIRKVSSAAGLSVATVGDYFSGAHLPSATSLSAILAAIGVDSPEEVAAWRTTLTRVRRRPGPRPSAAHPPYRGLAGYQTEDAEWFFGREQLVELLIDRLADRRRLGHPTLVVVGASGSGKSSLIRAGVIPQLQGTGCEVLLLTPGDQPVRNFDKQTSALDRDSRKLTIIVDQFEELFTECGDETERRQFIARLVASDATVVLGLRADFYARTLAYPELAGLAQDGQVVVGPMTETQVRSVITQPAIKAKVDIEEGLVDLVLRDLRPGHDDSGDGAHEAGTLPQLSHALLATWRAGGHMTTARYRETGGISGAVARTAESVYGDLDEAGQEAARRLLLRLIRVTEDGVTRRRVGWTDLRTDAGTDEPDAVLEHFIDHRLITANTDAVEISHDALLRAWPRLRAWIDADRTGLRAVHALTDAADAWSAEGRDPEALYRGSRLAAVREWLSPGRRGQLSARALEFYDASDRRAHRRSRVVRATIAGFAVITLVAAVAGVIAIRESTQARNERDLAVSRAGAAYANDVRATDPALAMQLSLAAYRTAPTTEALSSLLDASASPAATRLTGATGTVHAVAFGSDFRLLAAAGADARVRLWDVSEPNRPTQLGSPLPAGQDIVTTVAISPDGRRLAAAGYDRTVRLWDVAVPSQPRPIGQPLTGPTDIINSIAFSPDSSLLAAASADTDIHLWDLADGGTGSPVRLSAGAGVVNGVAFRPDGAMLASAHNDGTVHLWNTSNRNAPTAMSIILTGRGAMNTVAFSPDGRLLAAGGADMSIRLWPLSAPAPPPEPTLTLAGPTSRVFAVAFSPDSRTVAAASADESVRVWNATTGRLSAVLPHPGPVTAVAFGRNGRTLATGAADGVTRLWALPTPVLTGPDRSIFTVAFSPDRSMLAAGSGDGTVRLWELATPWRPGPSPPALTAPAGGSPLDGTVSIGPGGRLAAGAADGTVYLWPSFDASQPRSLRPPEAPGAVESVAFNPRGDLIAAGHATGRVGLWDSTTGANLAVLSTTSGANAFAVTFSPDGRILAAASADKTVRLWDLRDRAHPALLGEPLTGPTNYAYHVAFSPDGRTLAASSADGAVYLWDVSDPVLPHRVGPPLAGPKGIVYAVAFSPDGHILATANTDKTVWLWDLANPATPHLRAVLTGFERSVFSVAFDPDGRTLAAAGRDGEVRLWNTDPDEVAAHICAMAGAPIDSAEWGQYFPGRPYNPPC